MTTTVTRSTAEVLRLMRKEWTLTYIDAILVDTTGAGTQPTAASSVEDWLNYAIVDPYDFSLFPEYPSTFVNTTLFTYDSIDGRAESPVYTFNFSSFISGNFSIFSSNTVTHIILCDVYEAYSGDITEPPYLVLSEVPSLTLTSSTALSRSIQLFGRAAT